MEEKTLESVRNYAGIVLLITLGIVVVLAYLHSSGFIYIPTYSFWRQGLAIMGVASLVTWLIAELWILKKQLRNQH